MITIVFQTSRYTPDYAQIDLRTSKDGWEARPLPGVYDRDLGAWKWELDYSRYKDGFKCKFFGTPFGWHVEPDLEFVAGGSTGQPGPEALIDGRTYRFPSDAKTVTFPPRTLPFVETGLAQRMLFEAVADPNRRYDVIVIGSGMAGGTLADHLADSNLDVLVLEAGGFLFPTHIGNLSRAHSTPGVFSKHIWSLWDRFKVANYDTPASEPKYKGGQGFNLGGRSLFWGGFIPRMTSWELEQWPQSVKLYLEDVGYTLAEEFMGRSTGPRTTYNRQVHLALRKLFPFMHHADAPMAIRQNFEGANAIGTGVFSTADVLIESKLSENYEAGKKGLDILLNHEVVRVEPQAAEVRVVARDRARDLEVSFRSKTVVLSAGCIESARLAYRSQFPDPGKLIGKGASDHPIFYTHFSIPRESPYFDPFGNVKTLSQPKGGKIGEKLAPFNMLLELGADLNQGRYIDEDIWLEHLDKRKEKMLCELVFLCNVPLNPDNQILFDGDAARPLVSMRNDERPDLVEQTDKLKWDLFKELRAQPTSGEANIEDEAGWRQSFLNARDSGVGDLGSVAHEVGSLRMQVTAADGSVNSGLVDENCLYMGVPGGNVYVCDLSIFPTSPAANPSLTVVALAIRLAEHLRKKLKEE
jgi:choline dehydrogenase-like flavoprotein